MDKTMYISLLCAAFEGDLIRVAGLLKEGQSVDAVDLKGTTALMEAARGGHCGVIQLLLRSGASVNATDQVYRKLQLHYSYNYPI